MSSSSKIISITGANRGIGKSIVTNLHPYYRFAVAKSRIENIDSALEEIAKSDVFINNASMEFHQCTLFQAVYERWRRDESKFIINIGSRSAEPYLSRGPLYSANKAALMHLTKLCIFNDAGKKCKLSLLNLGLVESDYPSLKYHEISSIVQYSIELPYALEVPIINLQHRAAYKAVQIMKLGI